MGGGADGLALVRHLIKSGADPNSRNDEGYSPLHYAATVEIAEALVELGADVNAAGFLCGRTPLHIHSLRRDTIARRLIALGGSLSIKDNNGKTAYDLGDHKLRAMIDNDKYFCGRFDVNARAPEHVSITSVVVRAMDIHTHTRLGGVHSGGTTGVHVSVSNAAMEGLTTVDDGSGDEVVIKLIKSERDFRRELDQVEIQNHTHDLTHDHDQSIHPSINPSINQSINPSIHPSINQSINQSTNHDHAYSHGLISYGLARRPHLSPPPSRPASSTPPSHLHKPPRTAPPPRPCPRCAGYLFERLNGSS